MQIKPTAKAAARWEIDYLSVIGKAVGRVRCAVAQECPGAISVRAKPPHCAQPVIQPRPLQRQKLNHAPDHRAADRRDRNERRTHGNAFHRNLPAMNLEDAEPIAAQQLFEGFFEIEPDCKHDVASMGR